MELPKELVARVKAVKPSWLIELTDEEYLGHVVARGNFDDYLQQLENANAAVKKLAAVVLAAVTIVLIAIATKMYGRMGY